MNKKIGIAFFLLLITSLVVSGCGGSKPVKEPESSRLIEDSYRVGILLSKESEDPLSLEQELLRVLQGLQDETGLESRYIYASEFTSDPEALSFLAESGCDMVFYPASRDAEEYAKVAASYPDTRFISFGDPEEMNDLISIAVAKDETAYVVGFIASAISKTGKIGMLYAIPDPQLEDIEKAFKKGAQDYAREAEKEIAFEFQNLYVPEDDPEQPELLRALAFNMKNKGVDVIYHNLGVNSDTLISWSSENQITTIGSYFSQTVPLEYPEIVQIIFNLSPIIKGLVLEDMEGEILPGPRIYSTKDKVIEYRGLQEDRLPLPLLDRVQQIIKDYSLKENKVGYNN